VISNSGEPLTISPDELFVRFKKDDSSKESLGLGLSIIKSILDSYGYSISYNYINQLHVFEIMFK
jgi:K+-sensing histidine kinase KdpD